MIRKIIKEELLKELDMSIERGLLSYLMINYETMDNSFTKRHGDGEEWFTKEEMIKHIQTKFKVNKDMATNIVEAYLESENNKNFGV